MKSLYGYKLNPADNIVDLGGGYGDLSVNLISAGYKIKAFIEPDDIKFSAAKKKLETNAACLHCKIDSEEIFNALDGASSLTIVMQDVIEHIPLAAQKYFFDGLRKKGIKFTLIGRTPNLKSPFGLRNSFGDNTHIHRFTDMSLRDFLSRIGFNDISIRSEPYKITGIVSLVRIAPYYLTILLVSAAFIAIYGSREGWMTPNLVFRAE